MRDISLEKIQYSQQQKDKIENRSKISFEPVSTNDGINRAKTFWPENRSRRELESSTTGIERYGVVFGNKQFELVFHPLSCSRP